MKTAKKNILRAIIAVLTVASFAPAFTGFASAAPITNRSVTIGSSAASASTSYSFAFNVPSTTPIQSASFTACTTASGACTTPAGFSITGSTFSSVTSTIGTSTGWTANTSTAGSLRIVNATNTTAPTNASPITVVFNTVTNPSATNATYFFRMSTFSDSAWTTVIDTGTVATSTAGQVTVTAAVDEALTFTLSSSTVPLTGLTPTSTGSGTSSMSVSTNAATGYGVTVNGTTLTSAGNTITALSTPTASATGTKQFGLNLVANTTPVVGTVVSGAGSGTAQTGYNSANNFKFVTGNTVAAATVPTNNNTYTISYIGNIDSITNPGAYSTVLTYVATANF
jgi:hypothetical protein